MPRAGKQTQIPSRSEIITTLDDLGMALRAIDCGERSNPALDRLIAAGDRRTQACLDAGLLKHAIPGFVIHVVGWPGDLGRWLGEISNAAVMMSRQAAGGPRGWFLEATESLRNARKAIEDILGVGRPEVGGLPMVKPEAAAVEIASRSVKPNAPAGRRRGRLSKDESEAKRTAFLAKVREHSTLKYDPAALGQMVGVSESTARRWLADEDAKYRASKAANADPNETRVKH